MFYITSIKTFFYFICYWPNIVDTRILPSNPAVTHGPQSLLADQSVQVRGALCPLSSNTFLIVFLSVCNILYNIPPFAEHIKTCLPSFPAIANCLENALCEYFPRNI